MLDFEYKLGHFFELLLQV